MMCVIIWMWRLAPLLPFIMVKSRIIIWMTIRNNRVERLAETCGLADLSEGLVFSEVDCGKWRSFFGVRRVCSGRISAPNAGSAGLDGLFFFCCSSSLLLHKPFKTPELRGGVIFEKQEPLSRCWGIFCPWMLQVLWCSLSVQRLV